jgi:hypothetical protein
MTPTRLLITALVSTCMLHGIAAAQFDHLQCWKVKPDHKAKGYVDLAPLQAQLPANANCKIVGPKLFCAPVHKTIVEVDPPPIGAPAGPTTGDFLCYKAKCDTPADPVTAADQFDSYQLQLKKSFLLCAPAIAEGATTTTTSTSTSTTLLCTSDVMQCPDGSYVGRDPLNNCQFYPCP